VELHAHLFMKEGMGWGFTGDFFGELRASGWSNQLSSMANPDTLERSGIGIVVAALYAHPVFTLSLRASIRKQIEQARKFVTEHPGWVIARSSAEARAALESGKRVMVLALEGASGIIESEEDLAEFVDRGGIRIVNLLHLTDDEYGGVAFLPGIKALTNPWTWLKGLFSPARDESGVRVNPDGLTDRGRKAALAFLKRGVWLDLAHASDASYAELVPLLRSRGQPHLYTHAPLRKYMKAERGVSEAQLKAVKLTGGIVGVMPADTMLEGTPPSASPPCDGAFGKLKLQYTEAAAIVGAESVMMGSDWNGGVKHLQPTCETGTSLDREGLWNIGQQGQLWKALEASGAPVPKPLGRTIERFLDAWAKVR
jgi:microsomal dipeptidase-like Zn-dependent dipeptidase